MAKDHEHKGNLGKGLDDLMELVSGEIEASGLFIQLEDLQEKEVEDTLHERGVDDFISQGIQLLKRGDYLVAAAYFLAATLVSPHEIRALNNLGVCWFHLKRSDEARKAFLKVLEIEPENSTAKKNLERIS